MMDCFKAASLCSLNIEREPIVTRLIRPLDAVATITFVCLLCLVGCKEDQATPVPPEPAKNTTPAATSEADAKAVSEFLNKDKPGSSPSGALPPNHPPIDGMGAAPPAPKPGTGLPDGHPPIPQGTGAGMAPSGGLDAVIYSVPKEWTPQPVTSQMRKAQFLLPRAEGDTEDGQMVVFYFGAGQGGAVEANIDRWKKMFTTADGNPVPDSDVKLESHDVNGLKVTTLDVTGRYADPMAGRPAAASAEYRMLSAIVEMPDGPWFFKGVGPVATMKAHEQNFKDFVASIKGKP